MTIAGDKSWYFDGYPERQSVLDGAHALALRIDEELRDCRARARATDQAIWLDTLREAHNIHRNNERHEAQNKESENHE